METDLVRGRDCDACTVCCTELTVDQPEFQKLPGHTCENCAAGVGCSIYETRPRICRVWFCGWRKLDWVDVRLRPDLSDVLICLTLEPIPAGYEPGVGLDIALLTEAGARAEGLAETIAHAIRANIAVFLCVVGAPGKSGARMLVNDELRDLVLTGRAARIARELRHLRTFMLVSQAERLREPVVLTHGPR
jgi:hypothetical protein